MWKSDEYGTRRCINCGYLGKKDINGFNEECFTASAEDRVNGLLARHRTLRISVGQFITVPWSSVGKANLKEELDHLPIELSEEARTLNVIMKDRGCPSWYPWREFASPREQWEESVMLAMEDRQRKFEQQMEEARQGFELRLEERNRHERQRTDRIMIWLGVAAIIFAAAQVYAAMASINPDHPWFRWLR
jgi:hypothetical protein